LSAIGNSPASSLVENQALTDTRYVNAFTAKLMAGGRALRLSRFRNLVDPQVTITNAETRPSCTPLSNMLRSEVSI
jgi:hypothetical protein